MSEGKVAKKFALYPPKDLVRRLGLKEGQRVRYEIEDGKLVVEPLPDPIDVALRSKKWMKVTAREIESESEKEQSELYA
jgi:bifunctional DNA-binding transcriptional regulator/antitoxin component of YhaV-PrlF toxin-antitoxin module